MRSALIVVVGILAFSCRDILPLQPSNSTRGFQLNGTVTTPNGIPLDSVDVRVFYNYDLVQTTPIDTQQVLVKDPSRIVDVAVYTPDYQFVRQLYLSYWPVGPVPRFTWDGHDADGALVPSGKYLIRYVVDTLIVKYSTVIIDGHRTTTTDPKGRFTLSAARLPVEEMFDHYRSNNTYEGTYRVLPEIDLVFTKSPLSKTYTGVSLDKNRITTVAFTLE
ncbi:MAG: hypothetical protein HY033_07985 [Ignavibacteriae bacterium]|nr:hypothetical protein [Ignavibacteriota bacterium]